MKALKGLLLILLALQILLTEETQVTKIKKGSNVHVNVVLRSFSCQKTPKNCAEVLRCGGRKSGVYKVKPDNVEAFKVYCDQKTNGGGWTVFQKRKDGSVDFYRGWTEYKKGFGDLNGEFWLGLEKIYRLSHQTRNRLRVDLEDTTGNSAYAEYDYFAVSSEGSKYGLSLGTYTGTAGDSLFYHRGMAFTTKDHDSDKWSKNCAVEYKGAWWYNACYRSNLNGLYLYGKQKNAWKGHSAALNRFNGPQMNKTNNACPMLASENTY